jgi:hypothetical protein
MASTNGVESAPLRAGSTEPFPSAKRKRDVGSEEENNLNEANDSNSTTNDDSEAEFIRDLIDVLKA